MSRPARPPTAAMGAILRGDRGRGGMSGRVVVLLAVAAMGVALVALKAKSDTTRPRG